MLTLKRTFSPLPSPPPIKRTLFGCLLPATSTIKYSQVVLTTLPRCLESEETFTMCLWSSTCQYVFFVAYNRQMDFITEDAKTPFLHPQSGQFILHNQTNSVKQCIVSARESLSLTHCHCFPYKPPLVPLFLSSSFPVIQKKMELYRMTYKCREFYCTKMRSLVRPQCFYGVTAGAKALE